MYSTIPSKYACLLNKTQEVKLCATSSDQTTSSTTVNHIDPLLSHPLSYTYKVWYRHTTKFATKNSKHAGAIIGAVKQNVKPSMATIRNTPTSRPIRIPLGEYFTVRSRFVTAHPKTHRYRRTAQQIIPGCGRINRCMGKYTERKNTNTRKKLLLIGKTRPKCFWMLYVVLSWPRACCAKLVSAPPVMPPNKTLTNPQTK
mmetsp:Transcript_2408/g.9313  ORF Transcript_2408/g.9313 Transcript_2408/m.9313 type:complete len:200 (+) Transcript_2408:280-879(+)